MVTKMKARFQILRKNEKGEYVALQHSQLFFLSPGSFCVLIGKKEISFDWNQFWSLEVTPGVFEYASGSELSDNYDEQLVSVGLNRKDLAARYLAGASYIDEFFVSFDDEIRDDVSTGSYLENKDPESVYRIKLLSMAFLDENNQEYPVAETVIEMYNRGNQAAA